MKYEMTIAGLKRQLPLCPINENLYIGAFVMFGDPEITVAAARDLLQKAPEFDVIVTAEFGNYTGAEAVLSDLPMTGLYVKKGTGVDGGERKLPAVKLPGGLTWGSNQKEIEGLLGEASFAGGFIDADFDLMYENGSFYLELAGSNENGVDYIVYSME